MTHHSCDRDWVAEYLDGPKVVFLESPFAGKDLERNIEYARRAMWDSLLEWEEAPVVTHLLYPQNPKAGIVCDSDPRTDRREVGIRAGNSLRALCDKVVIYTDYGITPEMQHGISEAMKMGKTVEYRHIGENPDDEKPPQ